MNQLIIGNAVIVLFSKFIPVTCQDLKSKHFTLTFATFPVRCISLLNNYTNY